MGMISDMFCSSPASTATRKTHHQSETNYNNIITTPRLIRVFSSSTCRNTNDVVALNPNKPAAVVTSSRYEYKQLLQTKKNSNSSCYGADHVDFDQQLRRSRRRRSSADATDLKKELITIGGKNIKFLSDSDGTSKLSRRSISYDQNPQPKSEDQNAVLERSGCRLPPIRTKSVDVSTKLKCSTSSGYHDSSTDKVVVLWVSLHCKGCEAKVRKHISKMEGVKSFSTDWMSKRVTIISDMDPHDVLASVSSVKNAHFWPSSSSSSSYYNYSPSPSSSSSAALLTLTR